ncbi:hypothetical protein EJ06DRAFT_580149 [Trichodelitschia bisporula]|uniref:Uncharacterized protein n=1 Tax=Trichodelitschia bisporula TaxID=703511 RepID=A0A6G1I485_9PEZI|nr:hypothetical protein EJ06DRAFT_580149 [Trichodelitschia bisporula]
MTAEFTTLQLVGMAASDGAMFIIICFIIVLFIRARKKHKRALADLERECLEVVRANSGRNPGPPLGPVPPLPSDIASATNNGRPRSWADPGPSRPSSSSLESVGSELLTGSPHVRRAASTRLKSVTTFDFANSMVAGPRPVLRRAESVKEPIQSSPQHNFRSQQGSIGTVPDSGGSSPEKESGRDGISVEPHPELADIRPADSVQLGYIPLLSPRQPSFPFPRNTTTLTPRHSRTLVTPNGSPEQCPQRSSLKSPDITRHTSQLSHTSSTHSSNGNPFQWDPSPMATTKQTKPSALKGSPTGRKGHRRQNCVRICLPPTTLGPRSKSPSPSMLSIEEEADAAAASPTARRRALPRPPSISIFAPEVRLTALRASLPPSSPALSLTDYALQHSRRGSAGSTLTIPAFPSPAKTISTTTSVIQTPTFTLQPSTPALAIDASGYTPVAPSPSSPTSPITPPPPQPPPPAAPILSSTPFIPTTTSPHHSPPCSPKSHPADRSPTLSRPSTPPLPDCGPLASHPPSPALSSGTNTPRFSPCATPSPSRSGSPLRRVGGVLTPAGSPTKGPGQRRVSMIVGPPRTGSPAPGSPVPGFAFGLDAALSAPTTPALIGPRSPPAETIRASVARLQRMNNDARREGASLELRAARRYLRLGGGEASPTLEGEGGEDSVLGLGLGVEGEGDSSWEGTGKGDRVFVVSVDAGNRSPGLQSPLPKRVGVIRGEEKGGVRGVCMMRMGS